MENMLEPYNINRMFPMIVDMVNRDIHYYSDDTLSVYIHNRYKLNKREKYKFGFNISSMEIDHYLDLMLILDTKNNLFALCLKTNFLKLLSRNVTDFQYSHHNLYGLNKTRSASFTKPSQLCFYRFDSHIECLKTDLAVKKFVYYVDYKYFVLLLKNQTLIVYEGRDIIFRVKKQACLDAIK
ncbi:hypothetical protein RF11_03152 [Thelohanellus kitauei]|uniref:Uncharacterized protein n=1 Tax=Thelohanellus kitauei TaxID=669202 RepID=A0A0C2NFE3_THEKT|nr:hypothetical protein RF11_03152 [Thelohanellus kitauei]